MQRAMDINSDVGESFGNYSFGADAEIIPHLSSVNVACGFHAGDPVHMERTVTLAKENDVAVGVRGRCEEEGAEEATVVNGVRYLGEEQGREAAAGLNSMGSRVALRVRPEKIIYGD